MSTDAGNPSNPIREEQSGVHPSAVGPEPDFRNESTDTGVSNEASMSHQDNSVGPGDEYPEQLHAGKVGLGPEYGKKSKESHGITAKIKGIKEEIKGIITRNPDLEQKGKDRRSGELAHKEENAKENDNPFENAEESATPASDYQEDGGADITNNDDQVPTSGRAAHEQAVTTEREGMT